MSGELNVEYVPTKSLVPYANNAKEHPEEQVRQIASSIEQFGMNDPIAVWTNGNGELEIVEGHGRLLALELIGSETCPIVRLDHLSDEERRAYTHVHNQTTLTSGFDEDILFPELEELDFDWDSFGFDMDEFDASGKNLDDVDEVPVPEDVDTMVEPGQLWQLGRHRLLCGDSTDPDAMKRLMGGELARLVITDPPYNIAYEGGTEDALTMENDDMTHEEFAGFLDAAFSVMSDAMEKGASFYVWHSDSERPNFQNSLERAGLSVRQQVIWVKNTFTLGRQDYQWRHEPSLYGWKTGKSHYFLNSRRESTIIDGGAPDFSKMGEAELRSLLSMMYDELPSSIIYEDKPIRNGDHPTMKPIALFARLMRNSSKRDWLVLDPFGGSGTTLIAAEQWGRRCCTMELDPRYCDVIIRRWEDYTGKKAVLLK